MCVCIWRLGQFTAINMLMPSTIAGVGRRPPVAIPGPRSAAKGVIRFIISPALSLRGGEQQRTSPHLARKQGNRGNRWKPGSPLIHRPTAQNLKNSQRFLLFSSFKSCIFNCFVDVIFFAFSVLICLATALLPQSHACADCSILFSPSSVKVPFRSSGGCDRSVN